MCVLVTPWCWSTLEEWRLSHVSPVPSASSLTSTWGHAPSKQTTKHWRRPVLWAAPRTCSHVFVTHLSLTGKYTQDEAKWIAFVCLLQYLFVTLIIIYINYLFINWLVWMGSQRVRCCIMVRASVWGPQQAMLEGYVYITVCLCIVCMYVYTGVQYVYSVQYVHMCIGPKWYDYVCIFFFVRLFGCTNSC